MKSLLKVIPLHNNQMELIRKASSKNREAQHVLYEIHAPKMLSVCRYYIKDIHNAEDVMLNGFFKAFTQLHTFKNEGSFEGWLRKIMIREAISFLKQQKNIEFPVDDFSFHKEPTNNIQTNLALDEIQQCIDELPEGYKMVFVMNVIEGYKHHEIAELLQISEGTSKSQLFKAKQLLQDKINTLNKQGNGTV